MRLLHIEKVVGSGAVLLTGWIERSDGEVAEVYFKYPEQFSDWVRPITEPFVAAMLVPAMMSGERHLVVDAGVSPTFLEGLDIIQDILAGWYPDRMTRVRVSAGGVESRSIKVTQECWGSFCSMGVDSLYTLAKHLTAGSPLTHLIYVEGFEHPLHVYRDRSPVDVASRVSQLADEIGLQALVGETNLRDIFPNRWSLYYHGAGLAAAAHSLSAGLSRVLVPSSYGYRDLFPWGTSPVMDHLWSTEGLRLVHDGAEQDRAHKIADMLIGFEPATRYLRICDQRDGRQNCGKCDKCLRTKTTLHIIGAQERFTTLDGHLDPTSFDDMPLDNPGILAFARENVLLAAERGVDDEVVRALKRRTELAEAAQFLTGRGPIQSMRLLVWWFAVGVPQRSLRRWGKRIKAARSRGLGDLITRLRSAIGGRPRRP